MNNQAPTTAFRVELADGTQERIEAERVFIADGSAMFTVGGDPVEILAMGEWRRVSCAPKPAHRRPPEPVTPPRILSNATDL